jgi:hypothetical protein
MKLRGNSASLLLDSKVFRDQELKERRKQRFASLADVVHELEASQGEREFLVGNAPMRAQPTPQERPKAFHRVDVHFAQAVAIVSAGQLASPVVATLMAVTPRLQTGINAVRIGIHPCPWHAGVFDDGLDGLVLPVGQAIQGNRITFVPRFLTDSCDPNLPASVWQRSPPSPRALAAIDSVPACA